jgi:hypothetical protein
VGNHSTLKVVECGFFRAVFVKEFIEGLFNHLMEPLTVFLQIFLEELKEALVLGLFHKVAKGVGPLEDLPALHDLVKRLDQEFQLAQGKVLDLVEQLNLAANSGENFLGVFLGALVVVEAFEIEHVLAELVLMVLAQVLLLNEIGIALLLELLVLVAVVVAARLLPVLRPRAEAHPAEVVVADPARHVVAALALLNRLLTLGAVLRVGHDPRDVLRLGRVFQLPLFTVIARGGAVGLLPALPAERAAALAQDIVRAHVVLHLYTVVTPLFWAPPHFFVIIRVRFVVELVVALHRLL